MLCIRNNAYLQLLENRVVLVALLSLIMVAILILGIGAFATATAQQQ
jgi:hypothetical protein